MSNFEYATAPLSAKLLASGFLLLAVVGLGVAGLQIQVQTGFTARGALTHYRGDETTLQYPKSFGEMVEVTHAHAFTMPLLALTVGMALAFSKAGEALKRTVVLALFTGVTLELGLPWVVRYGPPWMVHLFSVAGLLLGGGLFLSVGVPLYEMWIEKVGDDMA